MWQRLLFVLPIVCIATAIKVPVDNDSKTSEITVVQEEPQSTPVYYIPDDSTKDSYLVPADTPNKEEFSPDVQLPATFLIPPSKDKQTEYFVAANPGVQSDWLPILQAQSQNKRNAPYPRQPLEPIPIILHSNQFDGGNFPLPIPVPSTHLEPPSVDAVNEFFLPETGQAEVVVEQDQPSEVLSYLPNHEHDNAAVNFDPAEPTLALHLTPPKPQLKSSTKLYPKKYSGSFKPLPIPIAQFVEDSLPEVPKAKPVKLFKPQSTSEVLELTPLDEKNLYHYQKAENQRKLKAEQASAEQHQVADGSEEAYGGPTSSEQETSETNLKYPGRNVYPAPLRQAPPAPSPAHRDAGPAPPAPDGRTEFRMHGMKGPHSYQFGYDTGKGKNRQFRYEERDNDGLVKGHYGYVDRHGKLRVVNYSAHPQHGFHAEEPVEKS